MDTNDNNELLESLKREASLNDKIAQLKKDNKSLVDEFAASQDEETSLSIAKAKFAQAAAGAISNIISLANCADSESVQLNASKFIIEAGLGDKIAVSAANDDELKDLFKSIQVKQPNESKAVNDVLDGLVKKATEGSNT